MSDILITGAYGQLGIAMQEVLDHHHIHYEAEGSKTLNIIHRNEVMNYFELHQPKIVYHCAAYTAVDKAEEEEKELNYQVNVQGTQNIVDACKRYNTLLVFVSTDYVFSGEQESEYKVTDILDPINEYGKSKMQAEAIVKKNLEHYYIVRTSSVYGEGNNFVKTMLRLSEQYDEIRVVSDQVCRPTWTHTLAEFLYYLVEQKCDYGIYHCSDDGTCSWYEFAKEILKDKPVTVTPISTAEYPTKAHRPKNSVMQLSKEIGFQFPLWQDSLSKYIKDLEKD